MVIYLHVQCWAFEAGDKVKRADARRQHVMTLWYSSPAPEWSFTIAQVLSDQRLLNF